jgi:hypothetical protein
MNSNELFAVIGRLRRAMPRNEDVLALCAAAEKMAIGKSPLSFDDKATLKPEGSPIEHVGDKFDKKIYQREYMRKRRAEGKA